MGYNGLISAAFILTEKSDNRDLIDGHVVYVEEDHSVIFHVPILLCEINKVFPLRLSLVTVLQVAE
ncbi:MAG: hypothetical protein Kow0021_02900 [Methanothermobacter thermautotrophicus]